MDANLLNEKFDKGLMTTNVLLGNAKLLDESSRESSPFLDPRYLPFYYYLGCQLTPAYVSQIGTVGGLPALCFLKGCKTVLEWDAALDKTAVVAPMNIVSSNILSAYDVHLRVVVGTKDETVSWIGKKTYDLGLITGHYSEQDTVDYLNVLWDNLSSEGLLVVDYINEDATAAAFEKFYRVKNRQPTFFNTRYGVGILQR